MLLLVVLKGVGLWGGLNDWETCNLEQFHVNKSLHLPLHASVRLEFQVTETKIHLSRRQHGTICYLLIVFPKATRLSENDRSTAICSLTYLSRIIYKKEQSVAFFTLYKVIYH